MLFKPATSLPGSPCHKEVRGTCPGVSPSGFNSVPAHQQLCDVRKFRKASEPQSPLLSNGADDRTCLTGAAQSCGCFTLSQYLNSCLLRGWGEPEGSSSPPPHPSQGSWPSSSRPLHRELACNLPNALRLCQARAPLGSFPDRATKEGAPVGGVHSYSTSCG